MKRWALLLLLAAPAAAQDRPVTAPTRDVDVTYRAGAPGQQVEQRSRWAVAEGKQRVDPPTPGVYMIVDTRARRMSVVSDTDRGVVEVPAPDLAPPGAGAGRYVRGAGAIVAGVPCTEWDATDSQGLPTTACFTTDGVLLRARRGSVTFVEAVRVTYGPPEAGAFVVPRDYARRSGG